MRNRLLTVNRRVGSDSELATPISLAVARQLNSLMHAIDNLNAAFPTADSDVMRALEVQGIRHFEIRELTSKMGRLGIAAVRVRS